MIEKYNRIKIIHNDRYENFQLSIDGVPIMNLVDYHIDKYLEEPEKITLTFCCLTEKEIKDE